MDRRRFLLPPLAAFATYALLREARATALHDSRLAAASWIKRQDELARGLAAGALPQTQWHDAVNELARTADVESIAAEIRRADLRTAGEPFGHDPVKRFVTFKDATGAPVRLAYGAALFSFTRDSVITPHAHRHMASAHMVIDGRVRIRTYDRVNDENGAIVIRPTRDEIAAPGMAAAMTTAKDNVHWFAARSAHAMTFDVIVDGLDAGAERYRIEPVDPVRGEHLPGGTIRAPVLTFAESSARFTAGM